MTDIAPTVGEVFTVFQTMPWNAYGTAVLWFDTEEHARIANPERPPTRHTATLCADGNIRAVNSAPIVIHRDTAEFVEQNDKYLRELVLKKLTHEEKRVLGLLPPHATPPTDEESQVRAALASAEHARECVAE